MKKLFVCAAVLASMVAFAEKDPAPAESEKACSKECGKVCAKECACECNCGKEVKKEQKRKKDRAKVSAKREINRENPSAKPEMNREKFREMREKRAQAMRERCAKEGVITPKAAIEAALAHAKLERKDVRRIECELEREDGAVIYDVEFKKGRYEYDYDVDARTGAILKQKCELD